MESSVHAVVVATTEETSLGTRAGLAEAPIAETKTATQISANHITTSKRARVQTPCTLRGQVVTVVEAATGETVVITAGTTTVELVAEVADLTIQTRAGRKARQTKVALPSPRT